ncbi:MAG TPA: hypothetical protein VMT92_05930, partial [Steroidobacteraceae bacterium]|nr:hypothetical protein [Steroidobacteraceae bacterium]
LGRIDDSLRYYQTVLARDPINPFVIAGYVTTLIAASRPGEAVQQARKMLELSPNAAWGHWYLAYALLWNKELDEALRQSALEPNPSMRLSCQALIARAQGDRQAEEIAMRALLASDNAIKPFFVAEVYAARGDAGTAIAWLERARLARVGWFSEFPADPAFDSIRRDSTFVEYIHRVRLRD